MWEAHLRGVLYPIVIVCPDGLVRHFAYANEQDAKSDADLAEKKGCQFYDKPSSLERTHGPCPGGKHKVRLRPKEDCL
jgi:hypothetical protein